MKRTKGFLDFIDAIDNLASDKFVDNLEDIIDGIGDDVLETAQDFHDLCYLVVYSRQKNRLLQGEDPLDVYGGLDYDRYVQDGKEAFEKALDKYK